MVEIKTHSGKRLSGVQEAVLRILVDVIEVCERESVPYYLVEGSCLGAIRHGGFIPWDDDMDIAVPVDCHDRLVSVLEHSLSGCYNVERAFGERLLIRIYDTRINMTSTAYHYRETYHPWLDIFLLCGMPMGKMRQLAHFWAISFRRNIFRLKNPQYYVSKKRSFPKQAVINLAKKMQSHRGGDGEDLPKGDLSAVRRYLERYDYSHSPYLFAVTWYGKAEIMPREIYGSGRVIQFEGRDLIVPERAEEYLERLYGDWQKLPPEEERTGKHGFTVVGNCPDAVPS